MIVDTNTGEVVSRVNTKTVVKNYGVRKIDHNHSHRHAHHHLHTYQRSFRSKLGGAFNKISFNSLAGIFCILMFILTLTSTSLSLTNDRGYVPLQTYLSMLSEYGEIRMLTDMVDDFEEICNNRYLKSYYAGDMSYDSLNFWLGLLSGTTRLIKAVLFIPELIVEAFASIFSLIRCVIIMLPIG